MDANGCIKSPDVNELICIIINRIVTDARQQSVDLQNTTQCATPADHNDRVLICLRVLNSVLFSSVQTSFYSA